MSPVWNAADTVAAQLARSPHLQPFRAGLAPAPEDPDRRIYFQSVQHILAAFSILKSQPMLVGLRVPELAVFQPLHESSGEVRDWLEIAQRLAFGFIDLVEFLRSRLPRYPALLVPDLCPSAPRVYADGFWDARFPWRSDVRRAGLQLESRPVLTSQAFELPDGGAALGDAVVDLVRALRATPSWKRFVDASARVDEDGRSLARDLRKQYRDTTKHDRVDAVAGTTGMRAATMRRAELATVRSTARGALGEYFGAFDRVDATIGAVAALVSHRLVQGGIREVDIRSAEWGPAGDLRHVRFHAASGGFVEPLEIVRVPGTIDALRGLVMLENLQISFENGSRSTELVADGYLLSGSYSISSESPEA